MTQKVIKVGTSLAVTIPKKSIKDLGFKAGDSVNVEINSKQKTMLIKAENAVKNEIVEWTDSFIKRYNKALKALADK